MHLHPVSGGQKLHYPLWKNIFADVTSGLGKAVWIQAHIDPQTGVQYESCRGRFEADARKTATRQWVGREAERGPSLRKRGSRKEGK